MTNKEDKNLNEVEVVDVNSTSTEQEVQQEQQQENAKNPVVAAIGGFFSTIWRWAKRVFFGGQKELLSIQGDLIESPAKITVKAFFRRKIAVVALFLLVALMLFSFVGPLFYPMDYAYSNNALSNVTPGFTMQSLPRQLRDDIKTISSRSFFSVGLSNSGDLFIWGDKIIGSSRIDVSVIPDEVKDADIKFAAAGYEHITVIDSQGEVYGWGNNSGNQFRTRGKDDNKVGANLMPYNVSELGDGSYGIDDVKALVCGHRVVTILMKDGKPFTFGDVSNLNNFATVSKAQNVEQIAFANSNAVILYKDGSVYFPAPLATVYGAATTMAQYLGSTKVAKVAATGSTAAVLTENGEIVVAGNVIKGEGDVPTLDEGEYFVDVAGGTSHYSALTNTGKVYSWGDNTLNQTNTKQSSNVDRIFVVSYQTYLLEGNELKTSFGLKGFLFGTDGYGRDMFMLVMHGGRMTMTVGAVAVIVSTVIAIIVGCLSGYFGGWVDLLLMRVIEIVSAIPFLPFALILSAILRTSQMSDDAKIYLIMVVLGLLNWTGLAHMIRGQVLAEREKEFVVAAKAMGVKETKIAFRHILPNVVSIILVSVTLSFAGSMLTETGLSYLGFGVQFPQPTWGNLLTGSNNSTVITNYWWRWVFPSVFLMSATICINTIGDTLRDILDPKSSKER